MANYSLKISIIATRLPDPVPMPAHDPGKDPIGQLVEVMKENMQQPARGLAYFPSGYRESGLTMNKEAEIGAESFEELAKVFGLFDELAEKIECGSPSKKPW
jgi:hypothetical protein